jgi:hypothetical protein
MICPSCHQEQPQAEYCSFCHVPLRIASLPQDLSNARPFALAPEHSSMSVPESAPANDNLLDSVGSLLAQEFYFEEGISVGRLGFGALGIVFGGVALAHIWVALTPFWGWAILSGGFAAWGTRRIFIRYAKSLMSDFFGEFSLNSQNLSGVFQQSFLLWLFLWSFTLSGVLVVNQITGLIPSTHQVKVIQAWMHSGRSRGYYLELSPWSGHSENVRVSVSRKEWEVLKNSKQLRITTRRGIFGIELKANIVPVEQEKP